MCVDVLDSYPCPRLDPFFGIQKPSKGFWGVDLHWCDLESLVGFPGEGQSPWDSDDDDSDDVSCQLSNSLAKYYFSNLHIIFCLRERGE